MKQYLDQQQTAKLIELGFDEPRLLYFGNKIIGHYAYTTGELVALLPKEYWDKAAPKQLTITFDSSLMGWVVKYNNSKFYQFGIELIDVIYNMILTLKEDRLI